MEHIIPLFIVVSLTYPLRPGWDIRPQSYTATEPCLVLWPALHPMRDPSPSAPSSPSFARCSLVCLSFFSQLGSISRQLWVTVHWASSIHDRAILTCVSLSQETYASYRSSYRVPHLRFYLAKRCCRFCVSNYCGRHLPFSYPLLLLSSTQSHIAGQP